MFNLFPSEQEHAMKMRCRYPSAFRIASLLALLLPACLLIFTGCGGTKSASGSTGTGDPAAPTVSVTANPASMVAGGSSTLTVTAANASQVTVSGSDGSSYTLAASGGTQAVHPGATATYTATATGAGGTASGAATVTVTAAAAAPTVTIAANPAIDCGGKLFHADGCSHQRDRRDGERNRRQQLHA